VIREQGRKTWSESGKKAKVAAEANAALEDGAAAEFQAAARARQVLARLNISMYHRCYSGAERWEPRYLGCFPGSGPSK